MAPRKQKPAPKPLTGFAVGRHTNRTKKHVCDMEGFEGFEITVKRLTFAEINDMPALSGTDEDGNPTGLTHQAAWEAIAPYVVAWNAQAETDGGDWEDVPPPAEAGSDAFLMIEPELSAWCFAKLKYGHLGGDELPKKSTPSSSTPETSDDSNSG